MTEPTHEATAVFVDEAALNARDVVASLDPARFTHASTLPGWTNAHLLAHIDGACRALARQLEHARQGTLVDFYDGGMEGRNEAIELGALMAPDKLRARVVQSLDLVAAAVDAVPGDGWEAPTRFRGKGTVRDCVLAAWREILIHATDLGGRLTPADWPTEFSRHLFAFLEPRVPAGVRLLLQPNGMPPVAIGSGDDGRVVTGMEFDLAAWLAGRQPTGPVRATASADAADLPELGPWPSAVPAAK